MAKKPVRTIFAIFALMLVGILVWFAFDGRIRLNRSGEREAELERRSQQLEIDLATATRIRTEAIGALREAESELSRLRDSLRETEEYISGLRDENNRLRDTIDGLADIRRKLGDEAIGLEELARSVGDGAREAIRILDSIRERSEGADSPP